jgi:hypothetical protein
VRPERKSARSSTNNFSYDLVARNQRRPQRGQLAFNNVQIGAANSAGEQTQKDLPRANLRSRNFLDVQRTIGNLRWGHKDGGFHFSRINLCNLTSKLCNVLLVLISNFRAHPHFLSACDA